MSGQATSDPGEDLEIWPIHVAVGGNAGWTLYFGGDPDVLLGRNGRVPLCPSLRAIQKAILPPCDDLTPELVSRLDASTLEALLAAPARQFDLDAAVAWFARPDPASSLDDCEAVLDAMNLASDIAATAATRDRSTSSRPSRCSARSMC